MCDSLRDFSLPQRCCWGFGSSGMWRRVPVLDSLTDSSRRHKLTSKRRKPPTQRHCVTFQTTWDPRFTTHSAYLIIFICLVLVHWTGRNYTADYCSPASILRPFVSCPSNLSLFYLLFFLRQYNEFDHISSLQMYSFEHWHAICVNAWKLRVSMATSLERRSGLI